MNCVNVLSGADGRLTGGSMTKVEFYRRYAADCIRLSQSVRSPDEKLALVDMAAAWQRLADRANATDKNQSSEE
jgi:hypothetical protein